MQPIVPAVIPTSRRHLDATLEMLGHFAREIQVDIVDGMFAEPPSWPYEGGADPLAALAATHFDTLAVELDLMVKDPETTLDAWARTGASRIVIHVESTARISDILHDCATRPFLLGLAFNNDTDLALLDTLDRASVDYIQLMGIATIGIQGQPFDERVLPRIAWLREHYPELTISIDGSVGRDTITSLRRAGATRFISGSDILKSNDPEGEYRTLTHLAGGA